MSITTLRDLECLGPHSSVLASLERYSPGALDILNHVESLYSSSNYYLENIAVYSCYFIGQLQESILLRVHWISIYRVHALRAFSFIFCACANLIAIATRVIDRTVWTVWQLVSPCFACASAYVSKPVLV